MSVCILKRGRIFSVGEASAMKSVVAIIQTMSDGLRPSWIRREWSSADKNDEDMRPLHVTKATSEQTPWHADRILGLDAEQTCNDYRPCLLSILPPLAQMPSIHAVAIVCSRRLSCWGGCCGCCCCCGSLMRCWSTEALSSLIYVLLHLSLLLSASKCQHLVVLVFTNLWQTQSLTHQILQMLAQYRSPQMPNLALKLVEISLSWNVPSLTSSVQDWQSIFLQNTKMLNVP